ncbi:N-glycosylase/DNA lyase [Thermococcus sp.]|uniref:N-glycosylase/DNA lyase n=1 Tax=Thermococcus sp. TaxID=35749 RepID=UPI002608904F|nr:N-glycosylase/DNA lyase [Thermococcus sp.]
MTLDRFVRVKYREDKEKVSRLVEILGELGLGCARTIEERVDLQFEALTNLRENLGNDELFMKLVIANALVSYQLTGKGEDWWWEFSRYFSSNLPEKDIAKAYAGFLPSSRTNRRLIAGKLRRLERLEPFLDSLEIDDLRRFYFRDMMGLRDALALVLGSKKSAKTIVFAVKMFGYAGRIAFVEFTSYPMGIDIPDDVRINAYTRRFTNESPVSFWRRIALETGIPPLHIDSILWPVLGGKKEVFERLRTHCEKADLVLELMRI